MGNKLCIRNTADRRLVCLSDISRMELIAGWIRERNAKGCNLKIFDQIDPQRCLDCFMLLIRKAFCDIPL